MNWTEQAETMMKTWTEAQKKAWEGWYDLARGSAGSFGGTLPTMDPMQMWKQGLDAVTSGSGLTGQKVAGDIFSGQQSMMRTLELLTKSWQVVAPHMEAGTNWQGDLKKLTDGWVEQMLGAPEQSLDSALDVNDLWRSFSGEWGPLIKPWLASLGQLAHGHLGESMLGGSSGLNRLMSLEMDGLTRLFNIEAGRDVAFDRLSDLPRVGISRDQMALVMHLFDAFVDLRKVTAKYRTMLAKAMGDVVKRTMKHLADLSKEGKSINSVRDLNKLWLNIADDVFTELYASTDYISIQRQLSSASMTYRIEQRKVVEMVLKSLDVPTRSELDDTYRTLYELRKEVKALKKALRAATQPAQVQAKPAAAIEAPPEPASKAKTAPAKAPAKRAGTTRRKTASA